MLLSQDLLREVVARAIRVSSNGAEVRFDPELRAPAKIIGEFDDIRIAVLWVSGLAEALSAETSRGNGEDFSADIDKAAQQDLLALKFWTVTKHRVEKRSRKLAAHSRGEPQMAAKTT